MIGFPNGRDDKSRRKLAGQLHSLPLNQLVRNIKENAWGTLSRSIVAIRGEKEGPAEWLIKIPSRTRLEARNFWNLDGKNSIHFHCSDEHLSGPGEIPESHSLVVVKVHPVVKFNFELKFILGDQDEPQEEIANELSIWQFIGGSNLLVKMNCNAKIDCKNWPQDEL